VKWVADALLGVPETAVIREGKVLATVASVPVLAGDMAIGEGRLRGVLAVAAPLDEARAKTLRGITNGQTGFLANTAKRGEAPRVELSAATEAFRGDLFVAALVADRAAVDSLFGQGQAVGPLDVVVAGDRRIVGAVPLKSATGETLGAFVVSRSRDEETAAFRRIRDTLLLVGALALLLALLAFLLGIGLGCAQPLTILLTYNHAPEGRSGEALGMRLTVNKFTQILVPVLFGGLGSAFGLIPVFWANGAFLLAGGFVSLAERRVAARRDGAAAVAEQREEDT